MNKANKQYQANARSFSSSHVSCLMCSYHLWICCYERFFNSRSYEISLKSFICCVALFQFRTNFAVDAISNEKLLQWLFNCVCSFYYKTMLDFCSIPYFFSFSVWFWFRCQRCLASYRCCHNMLANASANGGSFVQLSRKKNKRERERHSANFTCKQLFRVFVKTINRFDREQHKVSS